MTSNPGTLVDQSFQAAQQQADHFKSYLANTPGTQISYDFGYFAASHVPDAALILATDGAGEFGELGGEANVLREYQVTPNNVPTGAFNPTSTISSGEGLGIFADSQVTVTQKGLDLVSNHLSQFGDFPPNQMMLDRLQAAMDAGTPVTGADAVFYTHEASEATMMARGMTYDDAHAAALEKYGVSPYSVYHPDVVQANPGWLNQNWRNFWGIK